MAFEDDRRVQAIRRIKAKRDFTRQAIIFVLVGVVLVMIWLFTTRDSESAFFWPIFPILGMGIALVFQGLNVLRTKPIIEDEIRREMDDNG